MTQLQMGQKQLLILIQIIFVENQSTYIHKCNFHDVFFFQFNLSYKRDIILNP